MDNLLILLIILLMAFVLAPSAILKSSIREERGSERYEKKDERIQAYRYYCLRAAEIEAWLILFSVADAVITLVMVWLGCESVELVITNYRIALAAICLAIVAVLYRSWLYCMRQQLLELVDAMQERVQHSACGDSEEWELVSEFILSTVEKGFSICENVCFIYHTRRSLHRNDGDEVSAQKTLAVFCQMVEQRKDRLTPDGERAYMVLKSMVETREE